MSKQRWIFYVSRNINQSQGGKGRECSVECLVANAVFKSFEASPNIEKQRKVLCKLQKNLDLEYGLLKDMNISLLKLLSVKAKYLTCIE